MISRGSIAPLFVIADGALGFCSTLEDLEEFKETKHGRCRVHKIKNVVNCFPKRLQPQVKGVFHDMMNAEKRSDGLVKKTFVDLFHDKYPNGVNKLEKDCEKLSVFFFPAVHWQYIRTTRGAGSAPIAVSMAFKLFEQSSKKWRRIRSPELAQILLLEIDFKDGVELKTSRNQEHVA